jgi:hypothetical protein
MGLRKRQTAEKIKEAKKKKLLLLSLIIVRPHLER